MHIIEALITSKQSDLTDSAKRQFSRLSFYSCSRDSLCPKVLTNCSAFKGHSR